MKEKTWNINLYLLNFALLFSHEIDSAFWREWELFGIPGGIQGFLLTNFLLLLVALFGFKQLLQGARNGYVFSLLLAASGVFAFFIHSYFILTGHPEFTLPVSLAVLVLSLIVSLAQGFLALKELLAKPKAAQLPIIHSGGYQNDKQANNTDYRSNWKHWRWGRACAGKTRRQRCINRA